MTARAENIPSAHPVCADTCCLIEQKLAQIEREQQVRILFACESGSRAWGFASTDSDYDVRFIYVPRLSWYLRVETERDVIEQPISGDLDISGWELRKTLSLLRASNPTLLEWLRSSIVYRSQQSWVLRLSTLAQQYFSPSRGHYHYCSMAKKTVHRHLQGEQIRHKKYFYALRPLLAARWIRQYGSVPPMRFAELTSALMEEGALLDEIRKLLALKMQSGEAQSTQAGHWPAITAFIEQELARAEHWQADRSEKRSSEPLDAFLHEAVLHASADA